MRHPGWVLLLGVLLLGCGQEKPAGQPDGATKMAALARTAQAQMQLLQQVLGQAWIPKGRLRQDLLQGRARLDSFIQAAAGAGEAADALLARGQAAIENARGGVGKAAAALAAAAQVTGRCEALRRDMQRLLSSFEVPADAVFALRDRFQNGWLEDYGSWLRNLLKGADELLAGGQSQRAEVAGKNIERVARDGVQLLQLMQVTRKRLDHVQRSLNKRLPDLLQHAQRILLRGRELLTSDSPTKRLLAGSLARLEARKQSVEADLAQAAREWPALRRATVAAGEGAEASFVAFEKRMDALRRALMAEVLPTGRSCGIPDPGADKLK